MAWIIVDIGERDWSKLAYQFGHELSHVTANNWQADAKPAPPCQWLKEAMVEAFSPRGLGLFAKSWKTDLPFAGDNAFGDAIAGYREDIIIRYSRLADSQGLARDSAAWFSDNRSAVRPSQSLTILAQYHQAPDSVEALGAFNCWPERTAVPASQYLQRWKASCAELRASTQRRSADWPRRRHHHHRRSPEAEDAHSETARNKCDEWV